MIMSIPSLLLELEREDKVKTKELQRRIFLFEVLAEIYDVQARVFRFHREGMVVSWVQSFVMRVCVATNPVCTWNRQDFQISLMFILSYTQFSISVRVLPRVSLETSNY